ncbi:MAG TPA: UrcA family protein [Steroidobacteraceae bacterium]|nr:UrcA family protein [Steroidobacteraceae bacterium]
MIAALSKGSRGYPAGIVAGLMGVMVLATAPAPAVVPGGDLAVNYADLDINTTAGAETLYERIRRAAVQVCPQVDFGDIERHAVAVRCLNEAVAHAVNSIASPQLAAVYAARTHRAHTPA